MGKDILELMGNTGICVFFPFFPTYMLQTVGNKKLMCILLYFKNTPVSKATFIYSFFTYPSVFKWKEIQHVLACEKNFSFI